MDAMAYWYNVITRQVETDEHRSAASDLLGPYDTEDQARAAISTAHARSEAYDEAWADDDGADDDDADHDGAAQSDADTSS